MAKQWEERQISLGGTIIAGVVTLVIGFFVGIGWNHIAPNILPYLGFRSNASNDWSALDEVYNTLIANYDG